MSYTRISCGTRLIIAQVSKMSSTNFKKYEEFSARDRSGGEGGRVRHTGTPVRRRFWAFYRKNTENSLIFRCLAS